MPKADQLPLFERQHVDEARVRITRAGDGLSEALRVAPKALQLGDEVFYVLRGVVGQVNHKRIIRASDEEERLVRLHTVEATAITEVEPDLAEKLLNEAAEELARRQAEADSQLSIYDGDDE